jgi:hypothetical protein
VTPGGIHREKGFIVLEILMAGLILTSSIAATMYLFRMGFEHLERANQSNVLASKLTQATGLIDILDLQRKSGKEDIGDGVELKWEARLVGSSRPTRGGGEFLIPSAHELLLYRVDFSLRCRGIFREYQVHVLRHRPLLSSAAIRY